MSSRVVRGEIGSLVTPLALHQSGGTAARSQHRADRPPSQGTEDRILAMEEELETETKRSYEKGFQEGQAAAAQSFQSSIEPLQQRLAEILTEFAEVRAKVLRENEQDLVQLAIAVAKRILHRELSLDPEALRGLVKVALERVGSQDITRVRVHPSHHEFVSSVLTKTCPERKLQLVPDAGLSPGGLVFETERGDLDASIDSQLEEIRRGLVDRLGVNA